MSLLRRILRPRPDAGRRPASILRRLGRGGRMMPWLRRFSGEEWGVITVHNLFLLMTTACIGSAAVDVTHLYAAREQLQVAADLGAHATLVNYQRGDSPSQARRDAVKAIQYGMPITVFGRVVANPSEDIRLGIYDVRRDRFTVFRPSTLALPANRARVNAAMVTTRQARRTNNPVSTFFLRMAGLGSVSVEAAAVVISYSPPCFNGGFIAKGMVDMQSQNNFWDDFCIHSQSKVKLSTQNSFETGVIVSMPNPNTMLQVPDVDRNPGLEQALRAGEYDFRILDRLRVSASDENDLFLTIVQPGSPDAPTWLTNSVAVPLPAGDLSPANFTANRWHSRDCAGGGTITLTGGTYRNIILNTNCDIKLKGDVVLEDAIIATTSTSDKSFQGDSGGGSTFQLGRKDSCADGGGAQVITRGDVQATSKLDAYGSQILALGAVSFTSDATGLGFSVVSDQTISGTTKMSMTNCPTSGMKENFEANYFRLAR